MWNVSERCMRRRRGHAGIRRSEPAKSAPAVRQCCEASGGVGLVGGKGPECKREVSERCTRRRRGHADIRGAGIGKSGRQPSAKYNLAALLSVGGGLKCRLPDALIGASIFAPDPVLHGRYASPLFYCRVYNKYNNLIII